MTAQNKLQIQNINNSDEKAQTVDVLYQKMGDRWYAFSLVGEEVFMGSLSENEILNAENTGVEKLLEIT